VEKTVENFANIFIPNFINLMDFDAIKNGLCKTVKNRQKKYLKKLF
jgi:hypothetical protein